MPVLASSEYGVLTVRLGASLLSTQYSVLSNTVYWSQIDALSSLIFDLDRCLTTRSLFPQFLSAAPSSPSLLRRNSIAIHRNPESQHPTFIPYEYLLPPTHKYVLSRGRARSELPFWSIQPINSDLACPAIMMNEINYLTSLASCRDKSKMSDAMRAAVPALLPCPAVCAASFLPSMRSGCLAPSRCDSVTVISACLPVVLYLMLTPLCLVLFFRLLSSSFFLLSPLLSSHHIATLNCRVNRTTTPTRRNDLTCSANPCIIPDPVR